MTHDALPLSNVASEKKPIKARPAKMPEQPHYDSFTPEDRKALTEIAVHMNYVRESIETMKTESNAVDTKFELRNEKLEGRIRALENFRWWILGAAIASGSTAGLIVRFLGR